MSDLCRSRGAELVLLNASVYAVVSGGNSATGAIASHGGNPAEGRVSRQFHVYALDWAGAKLSAGAGHEPGLRRLGAGGLRLVFE